MSSDDITHKKQILLALKRRLHERELQAANYGLNTDPIINIEIEDIKKKIEEIENIPEDSKEISLSTTNNQIDLVKSKDIEVFGNENNHFNLTGAWEIEEKYEHGIRTADVYLTHSGSELFGVFIITHRQRDTEGNRNDLIVQEAISGTIQGINVYLSGTSIRAIKGRFGKYNLDQWIGVVVSNDLVKGYSEDLGEITGMFVMKRCLTAEEEIQDQTNDILPKELEAQRTLFGLSPNSEKALLICANLFPIFGFMVIIYLGWLWPGILALIGLSISALWAFPPMPLDRVI